LELQIIREKIYEIRGQKVMLDFDLAELYGVETKVFNQAVKRNSDRFPEDFMFIALKQYVGRQDSLSQQLQEIRDRLGEHDVQLNSIYDAIENPIGRKGGGEKVEG